MGKPTGFSSEVHDLIKARSGGVCEAMIPLVCGSRVTEHHHRRARGMGSTKRPESNLAANSYALCSPCHRFIETNRSYALDRGWLVRQTIEPASVPVYYRHSGWRLLDDLGAVKRPP